MKTANAILMKQARESLSGKWGLAIGAFLLYALVSSAIGSVPFATLILGGPLAVGLSVFSLSLSRKKDAEISQLFEGFNKFSTSLVAYLLVALFVTLWSLLLIIPGIIASISYSQTFFIIAEEPSIDPIDAMHKSQKMMNGYKWKYFCLIMRFFGWFLLSILTFGIGFIFLFPYIQVSLAKFYDDVKDGQ